MPPFFLHWKRAARHILLQYALKREESLRVVEVAKGTVVETLFTAEGSLGDRTSARMEENGAFVLELAMTTGFDQTETSMVLWAAPNAASTKGSYGR